ncbi:MAG: hypothetical protein ACREJD_13190 [Phycisphaerales bacterium]
MKFSVASVIAVPALACLLVRGQNSQQPKLTPVDQGVADVGPLSGPGRVISPGLRQPSGFDRVYEVEIDGKKYFARQNGSTIAVFPRSSYVTQNGRSSIAIPAGTTFYLGGLPDNARLVTPEEMSPNYAGMPQNLAMPIKSQDTRLDLSANALSASAQTRSAAKSRTISFDVPASSGDLWQSENYRVQRTGELIDAARVAKARSGT